jgi:hypothetical protein
MSLAGGGAEARDLPVLTKINGIRRLVGSVGGVPPPCQKQPTVTDNREYSRGMYATAELPVPSSRGWERQPDKDEVGGSSPPRPTTQTPSSDARLTHLAVSSRLNRATGGIGWRYPARSLIPSPMSLTAMIRYRTVMIAALCWLIQSFSLVSSFSERAPMAK